MKKITTAGEPIEFRVNAATVYTITNEGCLATDEDAALIADRLGGNVTVEETTLEEVVASIEEETVPEEQVVVEEEPVTVEETTLEEEVAAVEEEVSEPEEDVPAAPKKGRKAK